MNPDGIQSTALRYFAAVVQAGSLRQAAGVLNIAPSAVSRQIAQLEERLGAQLFERQTNRLVLTEQGRILAAHAAAMEIEIRRTRAALDDVSDLKRGHVRLAAVEAMVAHIVPRCIAMFQEKYPNLTISVEVLGTYGVLDAVLRDQVDFGLAFCPDAREEIEVKRSFAQPLYAAMAPGHPLAKAKGLRLAELSAARVALPAASFGIRRLIDEVAGDQKIAFMRCVEADNLQLLKSLVRYSDAVTFLPGSAMIDELRQGMLAAVRLTDAKLRAGSIEVLALKDRAVSKAAGAFLAMLEAVMPPPEPHP